MVLFENLLSRADTGILEELIGKTAVQLVAALSPESASPIGLKKMLLLLKPATELLCNPSSRYLLLQLLRPAEASQMLDHLGEDAALNPYLKLESLQFRKGSSQLDLLHSFFSIQIAALPIEMPPRPIDVDSSYSLFHHQRIALSNTIRMLSKPPRRALLHMPTGSGKTRTAMSLACEHLRASEPGLVLWLAASEELCDQASEEFRNAWKCLGNRSASISEWWGDADLQADIIQDGIIIGGLSKIYSHCVSNLPWQAKLGDRITLLIFDEAHQAVAPTYRHIVEALCARNSSMQLLGLSATPGRTWNDIGQDQELADFFARKKVRLEVKGYSNPIEYLVREGYLAKPVFRSIPYAKGDLSKEEKDQISRSLDIPPKTLEKIANDHARNLLVASTVIELSRQHKRIIVFAATVGHSELLSVALQSVGIQAVSISGSTNANIRLDRISWYKAASNETRVIVNFGVLTSGFDAPRTSAAIIARPTLSLVLYSQMIGRALRGIKAGGNAEAHIATVVDSQLPGFGDIAEAFNNWEDVWMQT